MPKRKDCTFCALIKGEREAHRVFEDDLVVAFLDTRPLFPGHCLLVPRKHVEELSQLEKDTVGPLFRRVQCLTRAVEEAMEAQGTFVAVNNKVSQSVPHLHVHVVPRNHKDGLRGFFWPRHPYHDVKHMESTRRRIQKAFAQLAPKVLE